MFLPQRNKEIFFRRKRENSDPSLGKGINLRRKGNSREEISSYMNFQEQMDIFLKMGEKKLGISEIENIFFGTNPVYELKPKKGTDDLILRSSSWLCLRKIKRKHGG